MQTGHMLRTLKRLSEAVLIFRELERIKATLELVKSRVDSPVELFDALERERESAEYLARVRNPEPLVTVCIATYNRAELLCERALPSICRQTYRNLEIVVIGDGCTDDTERRVARIKDSRIRFENRPSRGVYPEEPMRRWCVAGADAANHALEIATGDYITHLDDDDEHSPNRVETLLSTMRSEKLEVVFHPFWFENPAQQWHLNAAERFALGSVTTSSIMYDRFFQRIPVDRNAHLLGEPGDWNRFRKFKYIGARIGRHSEPLLRHFRERNQKPAPARQSANALYLNEPNASHEPSV